MWLYFRRGFLDRALIPKDNFATAIDAKTKELRPEFTSKGIVLDKDPRLEVIYDAFNMKDPVVGVGEKARAIRRAISLAIDQEWAREHLYNDRVTRVEGVILEEFPEFDPEFVNPWKRGRNESRADALARARKVLADAGITDPATQVPVIVHEVPDSTTDRQHFEAAKRDCAEIGIRLRDNSVTWQQMNERVNRGLAQTWGISWGADYPEAQNFLQLFYGPNAPIPNGSNYSNPEFDSLFATAAAMGPGPERAALYRKMERIVVDDCPWVIKYRRLNYTLCQPWLPSYRYNDLTSKYFKYCRVDGARRSREVPRLNPPRKTPVVLFGGGIAALVLGMLVVARRTKRGW
jgi:ABC-type oligopeptide transport system substrate-binding subunit